MCRLLVAMDGRDLACEPLTDPEAVALGAGISATMAAAARVSRTRPARTRFLSDDAFPTISLLAELYRP